MSCISLISNAVSIYSPGKCHNTVLYHGYLVWNQRMEKVFQLRGTLLKFPISLLIVPGVHHTLSNHLPKSVLFPEDSHAVQLCGFTARCFGKNKESSSRILCGWNTDEKCVTPCVECTACWISTCKEKPPSRESFMTISANPSHNFCL